MGTQLVYHALSTANQRILYTCGFASSAEQKRFTSAALFKSAMTELADTVGHSQRKILSALSMHAKDMHQTSFSLDNFSVAVIKKVSPQRLRREEFKFIDKFRTNSLGLNRYKS